MFSESVLTGNRVGEFTSVTRSQFAIRYMHGNTKRQNIVFGVDDKAHITVSHAFLFKSTSTDSQAVRGLKEIMTNATNFIS